MLLDLGLRSTLGKIDQEITHRMHTRRSPRRTHRQSTQALDRHFSPNCPLDFPKDRWKMSHPRRRRL